MHAKVYLETLLGEQWQGHCYTIIDGVSDEKRRFMTQPHHRESAAREAIINIVMRELGGVPPRRWQKNADRPGQHVVYDLEEIEKAAVV
jgi:hypothetical protein